ncbi:MAG: hypothetical protein KF830_05385 [Planctomycetes bacterium]|nr:hypothetical protein [Planctomycetota bacterium]
MSSTDAIGVPTGDPAVPASCPAVAHAFWRPVRLAAIAGPSTPLLDAVLAAFEQALRARGHAWTREPDDATDAFVTTARLHEPVAWRQSPLFTGRKRYGLQAKPATYTFVQVTPAQLRELLQRFDAALAKAQPDPADFALPGLSTNAWQVLHDQGRRGGAMMCVARLLQAQSKSLRVVMVVGDTAVEAAYLFDLAGAYPRIDANCDQGLCGDLALRIATHLSTREVAGHRTEGEPVPRAQWRQAPARRAVLRASRELGGRAFFTRMVRIADLVDVPALTGAVAQQYSEGCFGTWDPVLRAQVVTVTGSQHPVAKASLVEDDLAVITGLLDDGSGVRVRAVEGLRNDPPSSEAVEFESIDRVLPHVELPPAFGVAGAVPVVRSKLHGHRGVVAYDPRRVEYVPLDVPYFHYLVSCSTEAQAHGVTAAFARSQALRNPGDPRTVVFTILPGHGLLMAEKWVPGTEPFDVLLAAMDAGWLEVSHGVPQGPMHYVPDGERMLLRLGAGTVRFAAAGRAAEVRDFGLPADGAGG